MSTNSFFKKIVLSILVLFSTSIIFAKEPNSGSQLTAMQSQARAYRDQGLILQRSGDLDNAMSFYQKAVEIDPAFAMAYNDLGVIYEAKGQLDRAEEGYLRAIAVDPAYISAYTNLALFYEGKRDLEKAARFWKKRAELGSPDDPHGKEAKQRAEEIELVSSSRPLQDLEEKEILGLTEKMQQKLTFKQDDKGLSAMHFMKAKQYYYYKKDCATAIKEALDAQQLDPSNEEIEKFIEKVQLRALSK